MFEAGSSGGGGVEGRGSFAGIWQLLLIFNSCIWIMIKDRFFLYILQSLIIFIRFNNK